MEARPHPGYPSYQQVQKFMFETGFNVPDPDLEPAFPRAKYMKLAARIVDWALKNADHPTPGPWKVNSCCDQRERSIRGGLLAIATELDNHQGDQH